MATRTSTLGFRDDDVDDDDAMRGMRECCIDLSILKGSLATIPGEGHLREKKPLVNRVARSHYRFYYDNNSVEEM